MADPGVVRTVSLRLSQSFSNKNLRCALVLKKKSDLWSGFAQLGILEFMNLFYFYEYFDSMKFNPISTS